MGSGGSLFAGKDLEAVEGVEGALGDGREEEEAEHKEEVPCLVDVGVTDALRLGRARSDALPAETPTKRLHGEGEERTWAGVGSWELGDMWGDPWTGEMGGKLELRGDGTWTARMVTHVSGTAARMANDESTWRDRRI